MLWSDLDRVANSHGVSRSRLVWSPQIVVDAPSLDGFASVSVAGEHVLVQAFIPQASDEVLGESVLHWLTWGDEVPFDAALLAPAKHNVRRELGTVVRDDQMRVAAMLGDPVQFSGDPAARDRVIDDRG